MLARSFHAARSLAIALVLLSAGAAALARAHDHQAEARALVRKMGETVVAVLGERGLDRPEREARFRAMYRTHFDHAAIGAWAVGRSWRAATPDERREYLAVLEDYIVKLYVAQLVRYQGERILILGSEERDGIVVVTSLVIHPDPRTPRDIEMIWHFGLADGRLLVRDVVIDKISLALTERRAFAAWLKDRDGTVKSLIGVLREKIAHAGAG